MKKIFIIPLFIILFIFVVMGQILQEFNVTGDNTFSSTFGSRLNSEVFEIGTDATASFSTGIVGLKGFKEGGPGLLIINITTVTDTNAPNISNTIANGTFDTTTLTSVSPGEFFNVTVSETILQLGTNYSISVACPTCSSSANDFNWRLNSNTNIYDGQAWQDGGTLNHDFIFEIYGTPVAGTIEVSLITPIDTFTTSINTVEFNATFLPELANLTNATVFIYNESDIVNNTETNNVAGEILNSTNWTIEGLPFGDFHWNVLACGTNSTTDIICNFANNNNTLFIKQFSVDAEDFNNDVFETDNEKFEINITTISSILSVTANLIYNNSVIFPGTVTCSVGECNIFRNIDIPLITDAGESQNKSFFWEIDVFDGNTVIKSNTTANEQNVSRIHFEQCDATFTVSTLNFTAFDEQKGTRIDPFYFAGTFESALGSRTVVREDSFLNLSTTEEDFCIFPPERNFTIDGQIEYNQVINGTKYLTRNYYFDNDIINNILQPIPLQLLEASDSTSFILKVQDINILPVPNVLIFIQRLDLSTGNFTTVQVSKTDENGQTVGFFETETADYKFIIKRDGVTLLETTPGKVIPESAPFTLTFTVGEEEGVPWQLFEGLDDLTSALIFNQTTSIVTFVYADTSGSFTSASLLVVQNNLSSDGGVLCDLSSTLSSSTITCPINNITGTYTAQGFIQRGGSTFLTNLLVFTIDTLSEQAGLLGVFMGWLIILISGFLFKFNEIAGIVMINVAVIFVNLMGLVSFGWLFIFGLIAVSIIIITRLEK